MSLSIFHTSFLRTAEKQKLSTIKPNIKTRMLYTTTECLMAVLDELHTRQPSVSAEFSALGDVSNISQFLKVMSCCNSVGAFKDTPARHLSQPSYEKICS